MADIARLVIEVDSNGVPKADARVMRLTGTAKKNETATKKMAGAWRSYGRILAGIGIGIVTRQMVRAVSDGQKALAQLEAGLASTNAVSGQTVQGLVALSNELQRTTTFADDVVQSAAAVLLSFTNLTDDVFPRTVRVAADVATRMRMDLQATIVQLGKALNDPVQNLGALSRAGIQFSKDQKIVIKHLANTNQLAKAQRIILAELETQYGGSAAAARETLGGAIENLGNTWSDFLEKLGTGPSPALVGAVDAISSFFTSIDDWITTAIFHWSRGWTHMKFDALTVWEALDFAWDSTTAAIGNTWTRLLSVIQSDTGATFKIVAEGMLKLEQGIALVGGSTEAAWTGPLLKAALTLEHASRRQLDNLTEVESITSRIINLDEERSSALQLLASAEERRFAEIDAQFTRTATATQAAKEMSAAAMTEMSDSIKKLSESGKKAAVTLGGEMQQLALSFGTSFIDTLFDAEARAEMTFESIASDFAKMVARMFAQQALLSAFGMPSIFGPGRQATPAAAKGAAFSAGHVVPMARGGVVTQPTLFPMANGAGLMGEAGPEAVMPLTRTSSGELGVKAEGAGSEVVVNVINNTGAQVTQQRKQSGQRTELSIIIGNAVEDQIKNGRLDRAMNGAYGVRRKAGP